MRLRKRDDDPGDMTIYGGGAYGREVKDPFPEGVLAFQQPHEYVSEERLERARDLFPQASMDDYEITQTGVDRFLFTDRATGEKYRRVEYDPTLQRDPRGTDITAFVVDPGGRFHYLRPVGPPVPEQTVILASSVVAREVR